MNRAKTFEEFVNESLLGGIKNLFTRKPSQEEDEEESQPEKTEDEIYRELTAGYLDNWGDPRAMEYYEDQLQEMGRLAEFKKSDEYAKFKEVYLASRALSKKRLSRK